MPVIYFGHEIRPGPVVSITKEFVRGEDGRVKRKQFNVAARGKLVSFAGSPRADGSWWDPGAGSPPPNEAVPADARLAALRSKQGALVRLFNTQGKLFEIQPWDGSAAIKFNPRVKSVEFAEGKWFDVVDYTIQMEADNVWFGGVDGGGGLDGVEPEESWSVEVDSQDTRSYRVSHTISSQQKATFDENGEVVRTGWENAKDVVTPRLGAGIPAGLLPSLPGSYVAGNYGRSVQSDEANGRYSVTENYVYVYDRLWKEEFTVTIRNQELQFRASVEGNVQGFAPPSLTDTPDQVSAKKYANALLGWDDVRSNVISRIQANVAVGGVFNPVPLNSSFAVNPVTGVINYTFEYDTRPTSLVAGAISEVVTVQNTNPSDVFASLTVLGRLDGPVLQNIFTKTARVRSVSIEAVMPPATYTRPAPAAPDVTAVIQQFRPAASQVFVSRDEDSWVAKTGRYTRNVSWTYQ